MRVEAVMGGGFGCSAPGKMAESNEWMFRGELVRGTLPPPGTSVTLATEHGQVQLVVVESLAAADGKVLVIVDDARMKQVGFGYALASDAALLNAVPTPTARPSA
jgi:hypothetical protein